MCRYCVLFIVFLLNACLFADDRDSDEVKPVEWIEIERFRSSWITAIEVDKDDILYVAEEEKLLRSMNYGGSFQLVSTPDSASIVQIRSLDKLYIIGDVYRSSGGFFGSRVSWLYSYNDEEHSWKVIDGGYRMQDVTWYNNRVHIGRVHGITSIDLITGEKIKHNLIDSELSDHIEEIEASTNGALFMASHEGVHASYDNGENWQEITKGFSSDKDWARSIEIDEGENVYALQSYRLIKYLNSDSKWDISNKEYYSDKIELMGSNRLLMLSTSELKYADRDEQKFTEIQPVSKRQTGPYFEYLDVFSNDNIVLAGRNYLAIGKWLE